MKVKIIPVEGKLDLLSKYPQYDDLQKVVIKLNCKLGILSICVDPMVLPESKPSVDRKSVV